ncbi:MAG TPA: DNA-3-methyladenine glycosylase [Anaerolineae bacterium]|nr:DNA-3-methyladenine glycosylase [Anaerolineae bacterium]
MSPPLRLERDFFDRPTLEVARELLGQRLVRLEEGDLRTSGLIIETEAYIGTEDLGCHARVGRTTRNHSMWGPPGHAYVYFTYGMHWMLNFVTEGEGDPAAVLIRSLVPKEGLERMRQRRAGRDDSVLTDGPAKLCQALAIDRSLDGYDLCRPSSTLFVEAEDQIAEADVMIRSRIGLISVPEPWKSIPWRFRVNPTHIVLLSAETDD